MAGVLTSSTYAAGQITGRSLGANVGNIDPLTGVYTPGTNWTVRNYGTAAQTVTSAAAALPNFNDHTGYTYTVADGVNQDNIASVQNDYVYKLDLPHGTRASIVGGVSANTHNYINTGYANRNTPLVGTLDNPDFVTSSANAQALPLLKSAKLGELETTSQAYTAAVVRFFEEKLIASASYSYFDYLQRISATSVFGTNPVGRAVRMPATAGYVGGLFYPTPGYDKIKGHKSNSAFGLVYKPLKNVSLFYKQFQHCYEGSIAEGAQDKIQLLWVERWNELPQMAALTSRNPGFKAFVWRILESESFPKDTFSKVLRNASRRCPPEGKEFCRAVKKAASLHRDA